MGTSDVCLEHLLVMQEPDGSWLTGSLQGEFSWLSKPVKSWAGMERLPSSVPITLAVLTYLERDPHVVMSKIDVSQPIKRAKAFLFAYGVMA